MFYLMLYTESYYLAKTSIVAMKRLMFVVEFPRWKDIAIDTNVYFIFRTSQFPI